MTQSFQGPEAQDLDKEYRVVLGNTNRVTIRERPGVCNLYDTKSLGSPSYIKGSRGEEKSSNLLLAHTIISESSTFSAEPSRSTCPLLSTKP